MIAFIRSPVPQKAPGFFFARVFLTRNARGFQVRGSNAQDAPSLLRPARRRSVAPNTA